jgi:anti-sigma regulatory factor (Ser/Thr protein kinase)
MSLGVLAVRHDPASAALVRRSIADDLSARDVAPHSIDDVVLVASELVGNAVIHASASFEDELDITWELEPEAVVVRVHDGSDAVPRQRSTNQSETGGRGLTIVAAIALDWGVRRTGHGKQVWARIPVTHG